MAALSGAGSLSVATMECSLQAAESSLAERRGSRHELGLDTWKQGGTAGFSSSFTNSFGQQHGRITTKRQSRLRRSTPVVCISSQRPRVANLTASKEAEALLPVLLDKKGAAKLLPAFFQQPVGQRTLLNTNALREVKELEPDLFRCYLPSLEWLNFRVAPVVDLKIDTSPTSCTTELLSCRFEGSLALEEQNKRFSASMRNHLTWSIQPSGEQLLHSRVSMNLSLEVFTVPFTLLPLSAVEVPGNVMLHAMLERFVPTFLDHLIEDYRKWAASDESVEGQVAPERFLDARTERDEMRPNGSSRRNEDDKSSSRILGTLAGQRK